MLQREGTVDFVMKRNREQAIRKGAPSDHVRWQGARKLALVQDHFSVSLFGRGHSALERLRPPRRGLTGGQRFARLAGVPQQPGKIGAHAIHILMLVLMLGAKPLH
jgi:hypothetical protein